MKTMRTKPALTAIALAAMLLATTTGCPEKTFPVAPVSGTITINGKPVEGANIKFQPTSKSNSGVAGGGSYARTDAEGKFTMQLILQDGEGAVVGEHRVYITTGAPAEGQSDAPRIVGERVPMEWRDGHHTFEVPEGGTTTADFKIESPR